MVTPVDNSVDILANVLNGTVDARARLRDEFACSVEKLDSRARKFFFGNKLLGSYAIAAKKQRRVKIQKRLFE